jgi:hypothetical protein
VNKRHAFRPALCVLEDRAVPSTTPAAQVSAAGGGPLAMIHAQYVRQFQQQYAAFSNRYANDVASMLLNGTPEQAAASRPAFDAQILDEVNALAGDLASLLSLSPLAQRVGLTQQILQSLGGNGPDSLVSRLDALPTPTDVNGPSAGAFGTSAAGVIGQSLQGSLAQLDAFFNPSNPIRQNLSSSAPVPVQIRNSYDQQFQRAFADFASAYSDAATTTLLGGIGAGIAGNRAAFDAQVLDAANALQTDLITMLSLSPRASARLVPTLQQMITGSGPDSLVSRLGALPSPTDVTGQSAAGLGASSSQVIDQTFRQAITLLDSTLGRPGPPGSSVNSGVGSGSAGTTGGTSSGGTSLGTSTAGSTGGTGLGNGASASLVGGTTGGGAVVAGTPGTVAQGGSGSNLGAASGGQTNGSGVGNSFVQGFFANNGQGVGNGLNLGVGGARAGTFNSQVFGSGVTTGFVVPVTVNNPFVPTASFNAGNFTLGPGFLGAAPRVFGVGGAGTGVGAGTGFNPGFGSNAGLGTGFNFGSGTGFGSNAGLGLGFSNGFGSGAATNAGLGLGFGSSFGGANFGNNAGLGLAGPTFSQNSGFGNTNPLGSSLSSGAGLVTGPTAGFGGESGVSPGGSPSGPATPPVQPAPVGLV